MMELIEAKLRPEMEIILTCRQCGRVETENGDWADYMPPSCDSDAYDHQYGICPDCSIAE
jgi:hypothetical protein